MWLGQEFGQPERTQLAAAHFRSQLFGDDGCVSAVMDDLRPNEEDQFGAGDRVVFRTESVPNNRDSVQLWECRNG